MFDLYEAVTNRIMEQMENGVIPWHKGWTGTYQGAISLGSLRAAVSPTPRARRTPF